MFSINQSDKDRGGLPVICSTVKALSDIADS